MDKNDITNDIDDLQDLMDDLIGGILVTGLLKTKYADTVQINEPLSTALASLKSAAVDILKAINKMEGQPNG